MEVKNLTGQRFGRLVVTGRAPGVPGVVRWNAVCDCGGVVTAHRTNLLQGHTKSCGCIRDEMLSDRLKTHGLSRTSEHKTWLMARRRCTNPKDAAYKDYGGRGITMCPEWAGSFETFLKDMGNRPEGHTLEREDNDKGYCKSNCVWATKKAQSNNRRNCRLVEYQGKTMTLAQAAELSGINYATLTTRFNKESGTDLFRPVKGRLP